MIFRIVALVATIAACAPKPGAERSSDPGAASIGTPARVEPKPMAPADAEPIAPTETTPADAKPTPASVKAGWTNVPALGVGLACAGTVEMVNAQALVTCGTSTLIVIAAPPGRTLDDEIDEYTREETSSLEARHGPVRRSAHRYRHSYENTAAAGTTYWEDVMVELDGSVVVCQTSSFAPKGTARDAATGGDVCDTLGPMR